MTLNKDDQGGSPLDLANEDIIAAMKEMRGYIDITPADFMEIYRFAFNHAVERIARSRRARDVMTRSVITVRSDTPLLETAERMAAANISGVPVIDDKKTVVGVISEKDFLEKMGAEPGGSFMSVISQCLKNKGCVALPIRGKFAGDIMSAPAVAVDPDRPLADISQLFAEKRINRVPVVDEGGRLVGIVSRADMVHSFFDGI
ncbi:MAG: CBS domain-containing protein [Thermodesulfobacteriota bacterium]|nr:CBS domain-containing protein [Thermodesulfobacteriota bacterium]